MKKLKDDIKRMLNGLAYQNAGDFLSRKEKIEVLGGRSIKQNAEMPVTSVASVQKVTVAENVEYSAVEALATEVLEQTAA